MRWAPVLGIGYFAVLLAFVGGLYIAHARVWPFLIFRNVYRFVQGHKDEADTLLQKITNDMGIRPDRFLHEYKPPDLASFTELKGLDLSARRKNPLIKTTKSVPPGYIYIAGKFDFTDGMNGVLLLDTSGKLLRRWIIPNRDIKDGHHHLFTMLRDGSFVSAADYAALYRINRCGGEMGRINGTFHHSISRLDGHRYWVSGSVSDPNAVSLVNMDAYTVERTILLKDVHKAVDPELSIFLIGPRADAEDPWHNNDVEPLPAKIAAHNPFAAGDLLISYRHLDLLYVLDPKTLAIKWWTNDYTAGQHDPDWQADGTVTVFDNRSLGKPGKFSAVEHFDFSGKKPRMILDGRNYGFYSSIGGKHTVLKDGSILVLSYDQGRVLWVGPKGDVWFDFINRYSDTESLIVLNTGYLPPDYFTTKVSAPCD